MTGYWSRRGAYDYDNMEDMWGKLSTAPVLPPQAQAAPPMINMPLPQPVVNPSPVYNPQPLPPAVQVPLNQGFNPGTNVPLPNIPAPVTGGGGGGKPNTPVGNKGYADIGSLNMYARPRNFAALKEDLLKAIASGADVVGLQELKGKKFKKAKKFLNKQGYGLYGKNGSPIMWDKSDVDILNKGSKLLSREQWVGYPGAGPAITPDKSANWLRYKDSSGQNRIISNAHLIASRRIPNRGALQDKQIQAIAALQEELARRFPNAERYATGDYNTSRKKFLKPIIKTGLKAKKTKGKTHRVGHPDWILGGSKLGTKKVGSDHKYLFGSY